MTSGTRGTHIICIHDDGDQHGNPTGMRRVTRQAGSILEARYA